MKDYKIKISVAHTPKGIAVTVNLKQNKLIGSKQIPSDIQLAIKTALAESLERGVEDGRVHIYKMSIDDLKKKNKTTKGKEPKAFTPNSELWEGWHKFLEEQAKQCTNGDSVKAPKFTFPSISDDLTEDKRTKVYEILTTAVNSLLLQALISISDDDKVAEYIKKRALETL